MTRFLRVVSALLVKDFRAFWPFAGLSATLLLLVPFYRLIDPDSQSLAAALLPYAAYLAGGLFVIAVLQEDSPAGLRHDNLTRPIRGKELAMAKAVCIATATLLPWTAAQFVVELASGHSATESALAAGFIPLLALVGGLLLTIAATVTTSLVGATGVIVAAFVAFLLVTTALSRVSGTGEEVLFLGSGWVLIVPFALILSLTAVCVLWLAYGRRRISAARAALIVGIVTVSLLSAIPWPSIFAVQQAMAAHDAADIGLRVLPGCFSSSVVNGNRKGQDAPGTNPVWPDDLLAAVGPDAIAFQTTVVPVDLPAAWRLAISSVRGEYIAASGEAIARLSPLRITPTWRLEETQEAAVHDWILSRTVATTLAKQRVRLRLSYSLNGLAPATSAILSVGQARTFHSGIGYCSVRRAMAPLGSIVECFKRGPQPALLAAGPSGAPIGSFITSDAPDYTPAFFEIVSGRTHHVRLEPANMPSDAVQLVAFEARSHIDRVVETEGVLGGSMSACPLPPGSKE